jgi:hypothetical protein
MQRLSDESAPTEPLLEQDVPSLSPHRLGWLVADTLKNVLPERTLSAIYMHLGCRHYRRAIAEALQSAVETGSAIPATLAREIANWLDAYDGHPDQERISELLAKVRRRCPPDGAAVRHQPHGGG